MIKSTLLLYGFLNLISTASFALGLPIVTCQSQSVSLQFYQLPFPMMIETIGSKSEQFSLSGSVTEDLYTFFTTGSTDVLSISSNGQEAYTFTHKNGIPYQKTIRTGWEVKLSCLLPNGKNAYTPPSAPGTIDICDRGAVAQAIYKHTLAPCNATPVEKLNKITLLEIRDSEFSEIPRNAFDNLSSLTTLWIYSDKVNLHGDDFISAPNLKWLSITNLESVTEDSFNGLKNLEQLSLDFKSRFQIPDGLFSALISLKDLTIGGNVKLTRALFESLTILNTLGINANNVDALDEDLFAPLEQLSILRFNYMTRLENLPLLPNALSELSITGSNVKILNNAFNGKPIKKIWIHGGNVELSERWNESLSSIEDLKIFEVPLKNLGPDFFLRMPLLKTVHLFENNIETLPDRLFSGLNFLTDLRIRDNKLRSLPDGIFKDLHSLQTIDLQGNDLKDNSNLMTNFMNITSPALMSVSLQKNLLGEYYGFFVQKFLQKNLSVNKFCIDEQKNSPFSQPTKDLKNLFPKIEFDCRL